MLEFMTKLSRIVSPNSILMIFNVFSLFGGLVLLINFVAWASTTYGFDLGYQLAEKEFGLKNLDNNFIISHGIETYKLLKDNYVSLSYLSVCFLIVVLTKIFSKNNYQLLFFSLINLFLLAFTWFKINWILGLKNFDLNEQLHSPYNFLVKESIPFDRLCISIIAICFVAQLLELATRYFYKRPVSSNL